MSHSINLDEELNPRQLAYIRKLWRFHEPAVSDRAYKRAIIINATIAILALVLSSVGGGSGWPLGIVWFLGFVLGTFYAAAVMSLKGWRMWSAVAKFIDWKRVEDIATASEA